MPYRLTFRKINNDIREFGSRQVAKFLASFTRVTELVINEPLDSPDEKVARKIYDAIAPNRYICCIDVCSPQVTLTELHYLLSRMRNLREFTISECSFAGSDSSEVAAIFRCNRGLKKLFLKRLSNGGDMVVEGVAQALRFRSSLNELELDNTHFTVTGYMAVGRILQQCLSLTILTIVDYERVLDIAMAAGLAEGIKRTLSLEQLVISVSIPVAAGCLILDGLSQNTGRTLTHVELLGIELGHDGSRSVARLIENNGTFEKFYLKGCFRRERTIYLAPIFRALPFNHTLKSMVFDNMRVRMDGVQSICGTSLCNSTLETLGFVENHFEVGEDSPLLFHDCFKLVVSLKFLSLCYCKIENDMFVSLFDACKGLPCLEDIELTGTRIEDSTASALAALLEESQTLKRLTLPYYFYEEDVRALLDGVRLNYSLTELEGPRLLTDSQKYELQFYLDRNKDPARLVGATVPLALWPHALSQAGCYRNLWTETFGESGSDSESDDEPEVHQQGPDMLYFLVRELGGEIFRNVPTSSGRRRRSKRKRSGDRCQRTRRRWQPSYQSRR